MQLRGPLPPHFHKFDIVMLAGSDVVISRHSGLVAILSNARFLLLVQNQFHSDTKVTQCAIRHLFILYEA